MLIIDLYLRKLDISKETYQCEFNLKNSKIMKNSRKSYQVYLIDDISAGKE